MVIDSNLTNIERIIAKIDNDFNLDNSDWIPRIAAWVIDALSILKCTPTEVKRTKVAVSNKIARLDCPMVTDKIKVYDSNGCKVKSTKNVNGCCNYNVENNNSCNDVSITMEVGNYNNQGSSTSVSTTIGMNSEKNTLVNKIIEVQFKPEEEHTYTIIDDSRLELNFDDDYIYVEYNKIKTCRSTLYNMDLPYVPNNGILIEAITYYCMYKILCRGVKHPVFNLSASQYGTNPYYMWTTLQEKAKRSVMFDKQGDILEEDGDAWGNALAIFTFE
jgi:hypothetical protein